MSKPPPGTSDYGIVTDRPDSPARAARRSGLDILLVEADDHLADLIRECLEAPGREQIQIDMASTAGEAMEALRARKFSCVLVSHELPDGIGLDFLEDADEYLLTTPVIGLASPEDPTLATEYFRAGCVDFFFISEMLDSDTLRRGIARAMARFHRRAMGIVIERRQLGNAVVKSQEGLISLARTDRVMGICNRAVFDDYFSKHHAEAAGRQGRYAVCMIDVDRFKIYNDTYGHAAGDEVLKTVARTLSSTLRENDFIARYGGEEIVVLLDEVDAKMAASVGERLIGLVYKRNIPHSGNNPYSRVTVSLGAAVFGGDPAETPDQVLMRADQALYEAKAAGRNSVVVAADPGQKRMSA